MAEIEVKTDCDRRFAMKKLFMQIETDDSFNSHALIKI